MVNAHDQNHPSRTRQDSMPEPATIGDDSPSCIMVRLSDVEPQAVEWLWPGRFPYGKVSMVAGDPGLGKSLITLDIAARVSRGMPWPDRPHEKPQAADVLLLSAEDGIADTIRPRLDAMEADCNRIHVLKAVRQRHKNIESQRGFNLRDDVEQLRKDLERNPNIRLIIIDPISAYLGGSDSHNNAEVREALVPLCELAAERRVAVICVTHLNKGTGSPTYRVMGSVAFTAVVRAAWLVVKAPDDPDVRWMLPIKTNLAPDHATCGLSYTIESTGPFDAPVACWDDRPVTATAQDVLGEVSTPRGRPPESRDDAKYWLQGVLANGPQLVGWLRADAKANKISWRTAQRAKDEMKIESFQPQIPGPHYWRLPDAASDLPSFGESGAA